MIRRQADDQMPAAQVRADRSATKDEATVLRARIVGLERELARAKRCLASERHGREQLRTRLLDSASAYNFAVGVLCPMAFPADPS